ncbi:hypothetical protein LIER_06268 [Lithospermum erythrorhizon]|uniref:Uncharacterized protein n=1 Tax=Lithospermum erythrorhizon TaxID=34254 RepID=A0AAV3P3P7_LITER
MMLHDELNNTNESFDEKSLAVYVTDQQQRPYNGSGTLAKILQTFGIVNMSKLPLHLLSLVNAPTFAMPDMTPLCGTIMV